jgi:uncharacterized membrane protein YgdD (TMEM256/DUF423 family)
MKASPRASRPAIASIGCGVLYLVALGVAILLLSVIPQRGYSGVVWLGWVFLVGVALFVIGLVLGIWAIKRGDRRYGWIGIVVCILGPGVANVVLLICLWGIGSS